jgi:hypothetical protein
MTPEERKQLEDRAAKGDSLAGLLLTAPQAVQTEEYPPLPEPGHRGPTGTGTYFDAFTASQMHAYQDADRASRPAAANVEGGAVRILTEEELQSIRGYYDEQWFPPSPAAIQRKFCAVNAGRTIPASGEIGDV